MNERDELYVTHIAEAIERIRRYTATGRAAFMAIARTNLARDTIGVLRYNPITTSPVVSTLGAGALRSPLFICAAC